MPKEVSVAPAARAVAMKPVEAAPLAHPRHGASRFSPSSSRPTRGTVTAART